MHDAVHPLYRRIRPVLRFAWKRAPSPLRLSVKSLFGVCSRRGWLSWADPIYVAYLQPLPSTHTIRMIFGARIDLRLFDFLPDIVFRHGVWEPGVTALAFSHLRAGDVAIDLGANVGCHTLLFAHAVGIDGKVFAVEAVPTTAAGLRRTVAKNRIAAQSVQVIEAAVGPTARHVSIFVRDDSTGSASAFRTAGVGERGQTVELDVQPLRVLFDREILSRARLIKLDFEGGEMGVVADLLESGWLADDCVLLMELSASFEEIEVSDFISLVERSGRIIAEYANPYTTSFYRSSEPVSFSQVSDGWVSDAVGGVPDVVIGFPSTLAGLGVPGSIPRWRGGRVGRPSNDRE